MVNKQTNSLFNKWNDLILLDSGSTITTFMNPDLVTHIHTTKKPMGMHTNAGSKKLTLVGTVEKFGQVWYDPTSVVNIFGFADMIKRGHHIKYDSEIEDAFTVWNKGQLIAKFPCTLEGLYAYRPLQTYFDRVAKEKNMVPTIYKDNNMITTVKENCMGYTD